MASFHASSVDQMRVCMRCQGLGTVRLTETNQIVRDVTCDNCKGEGLIYVGPGVNPLVENEKKATARALKERADACMRMSEYARAAGLYAEALHANPSFMAARSNRVLAFLRLKDHATAIAEATDVIEHSKVDDKIRLKCLMRRAFARDAQDPEARRLAVADLDAVLHSQPGNPRALAELRKLKQMNQQNDENALPSSASQPAKLAKEAVVTQSPTGETCGRNTSVPVGPVPIVVNATSTNTLTNLEDFD